MKEVKFTSVTNDGYGASYFCKKSVELSGEPSRRLSQQIDAVNFRLRSSDTSYVSGFHVAGDPTLLIILSGTVRIELHNGDSREFNAGEMFVAEDYLHEPCDFNENTHNLLDNRAKALLTTTLFLQEIRRVMPSLVTLVNLTSFILLIAKCHLVTILSDT